MFEALKRLSPARRAVLALAFVASYAISFWWWGANENSAEVLRNFPEWQFGGYVLYDGYGNYAEKLYRVIVSPGAESVHDLQDFTRGYIQSLRPGFPLAIALLNVVFRNILVSAIAANLIASLLCVWAFNRLIVRRFGFQGDALFHLNLLFLTHVGIVGMLARPMADALALFWILLAFDVAIGLAAAWSWPKALGLLAIVIAGVLTKTTDVLLVAALPFVFFPRDGASRRDAIKQGLAVYGGIVAAAAIVLFVLKQWFGDHESVRFLFAALVGPFNMPHDSAFWRFYAKSAVLFLALALQAHPFFWPANREALRPAYRLLLAWLVVYAGQRFLSTGFNLDYSRARYGIPLVPAAMILAWPGMERMLGAKRAGWFAWALAAANYALWAMAAAKG